MPTRTSTLAKLDKNIVTLQFLWNIPSLDITPELEKQECCICKEAYQDNKWELGGTVHCPVTLPCGHVLGFQCLARWMLSASFDNHCSFCRAQIVDHSAIRNHLNTALKSSFARLEILAVVAPNGISQTQKNQLLSGRTLWALNKNSDRVSVVWEEILEKMCNGSTAPGSKNHEAVNGRALGALVGGFNWLPLRKRDYQMGLTITTMGIASGITGVLLDVCTGRPTTMIGLVSELGGCLLMSVIGEIIRIYGMPGKYDNTRPGFVFGVAFSLYVRQAEALRR